MRKVGIKELKNGLSRHIRAVAAGETLLVTDRDRVVAEIRPPRPAPEGTDAERRWAQMIREGIVTPARNRTKLPPKRIPPLTPFADLMRELDADRGDR